MLATKIREHRRERIGPDKQPAHHRRCPHRQVNGLAQPVKGQRTIRQRQNHPAQRPDGCRLGRGCQTKQDRPQNRKDQECQREERRPQHPQNLGQRHIGNFIGCRTRCGFWLQQGTPHDIKQIKPDQRQARQQCTGIKPHDRHTRRRGIHNQHDRWRDQDAQRPAGTDDAGGKAFVITGLDHRGQCQHPHQGHHRTDNPGRGRKQRTGHKGGNAKRTGDILGGDIQCRKQPVDDIGAFNDVPHEQEQRNRGQDLVRHHRVCLVDKQIEYPVIHRPFDPGYRRCQGIAVLGQTVKGTPHASCVKIRVVTKTNPQRHQRKRDGKAKENKHNEDAKHHQGDMCVNHVCSSVRTGYRGFRFG